jgi:hypothetical protein
MAGMGRRVRGDRNFRNLLRRLPETVKLEVADAMDAGGTEMLEAQQAGVPRRFGRLAAGLSKRLLRGSLRLRVGLIGKPTNRRLFYGRIVEFGRKAQTVSVNRFKPGARRAGYGPKARRGAVSSYQMRVPAMAPRPFMWTQRTRELRDTLGGRVTRIWERALRRAAGEVTDD